MIKAEVVTPQTNEVPSWLVRSRDALVNGPVLMLLGALVAIVVAVVLWLHFVPASTKETGPQSQPLQGQQLQVVVSGASAAGNLGSQGSSGSTASGTVGPAPADSLNSLQPTGTTQGSTGGQSLGQTGNVQSAGTANQSSLNGSRF
ncbi:MAG TPA: hypothetical protein VLG13_00470 [Patescibacteria group bacterium]|nr:hypothetical protein [Patescibacteria group bacterium]